MLLRRNRRWRIMTLQEVLTVSEKEDTVSIWHDALNDPMLVTSDRLAGQKMSFTFDDGFTLCYEFSDVHYLSYETNDGRSGTEFYNVSPAPGYDNVLFLHHTCTMKVRRCIDLIMDLDSGYAVLFDASLGHPANPREVIRTIRFGTIDGHMPDPSFEKPGYTNDLVGKAIRWSHPGTGASGRGIKYTFPAYCYLTYVMRFRDTDECFIATNPCDQIKIRDDLYICSTIEERQTGVELIMLMNLTLMRDVQTEFGIGGPSEYSPRLETAMHSGREGSWSTMDTDLFNT